ncbi:MGH1-like glycoside hydrolase domain-containing protein [Roseivirga sp. 4D4]|uniref:MGH1-like glycoside hydrolase domain-containing protein n=1 Tax=Roseivirga sp. 4D4 TaxID=1889784 RepID=UPI0021016B52|nr:trehalase family glycosidase [Roseivirga sp. 4D4]
MFLFIPAMTIFTDQPNLHRSQMPQINPKQLFKTAQEILTENTWEGRYTVPSPNLYPYQWNWDSGFVAMGFAHFDAQRAMLELESLFEGQWENGMLPHIIFHSKKREGYFPGPSYWESNKVPGAPKAVDTSGITQPPVHGFILEKIFNLHRNSEEVRGFVKAFFPKVLQLHRYLYEYRDPQSEGLAFIFHPWASGRDNSPLWDDLVKTIPIKPGDIPPYKRYDNLKADPSERPSDRDYDIYVYLMELGKRHQYNGKAIAKESPFLVQDTLFNAMLIRSNEALMNLGAELGINTREIQDWNTQSRKSFEDKLWVEALGTYAPYDLQNEKHIALREIGAYTALYAGVPSNERAEVLKEYIETLADRPEGFRVMPSFDPDHWIFNPRKYWKGPIWPQMNWLVYQGLDRYGFKGTANHVKSDFLDLVDKLGFHEYFDPRKSVADQLEHGYGGDHFSWTAAVVLDFIANS